jgi:MFS family permease
MTKEEKRVIIASSAGTVFEWYDFYLAGSLAANISANFFSGVNPTAGFIFTLLGFAAGFAVRPFGALFFGRLGDLIGRKYTFLVTMTVMGIATFVVGLLPGYATIGILAPIGFIICRLLQGLALGGEYGGAATYVAEHSPHGKRGEFTSWIQTTATLGLFLSLIVILGTRTWTGEADFEAWGWRIPFLLSFLLLGISVWIRLSMNESPAFKKMKEEGRTSKAPLTESFAEWKNLKVVILALFGLTMGQAVVWYTGQFYALFFLTGALKVDDATANILIAFSLLIGTPFFIVFGRLSDRIGRKPIIMAGCLLAALTYFPLFHALTAAANPELAAAQARNRVVVAADPDRCSFQFNPTGTAKYTSSCDIAKQTLAGRSVSYENEAAPPGTVARVRIGDIVVQGYETRGLAPAEVKAKDDAFKKEIGAAVTAAGYPAQARPIAFASAIWWTVLAILTVMVIYVTMVYGPIAAMLVELFPTRIRYTSMSLPYHIGNGWFGGLLPATGLAIVAQTGNMYNGLWYPIVFAAITVVVGMLFIPETRKLDIYRHD